MLSIYKFARWSCTDSRLEAFMILKREVRYFERSWFTISVYHAYRFRAFTRSRVQLAQLYRSWVALEVDLENNSCDFGARCTCASPRLAGLRPWHQTTWHLEIRLDRVSINRYLSLPRMRIYIDIENGEIYPAACCGRHPHPRGSEHRRGWRTTGSFSGRWAVPGEWRPRYKPSGGGGDESAKRWRRRGAAWPVRSRRVIGSRPLQAHGRANQRSGRSPRGTWASRASESSREAAGHEPRLRNVTFSPGDGCSWCHLRRRYVPRIVRFDPGCFRARRLVDAGDLRRSVFQSRAPRQRRPTRADNSHSCSHSFWRCHCSWLLPLLLSREFKPESETRPRVRPAPPFCRET